MEFSCIMLNTEAETQQNAAIVHQRLREARPVVRTHGPLSEREVGNEPNVEFGEHELLVSSFTGIRALVGASSAGGVVFEPGGEWT